MRVRYTKWGDRPHWAFDVQPLGDDHHGHWFGMPPGTPQQRADEPPVILAHDCVMLVPRVGDYTAFWNADDPVELYVDVTTAPVLSTDLVTAVDLDLDVIRLRDGTVKLIDEDEFELHQVRYAYPAPVIDAAQTTARWLVSAITARTEPFDTAGPAWLTTFQRAG